MFRLSIWDFSCFLTEDCTACLLERLLLRSIGFESWCFHCHLFLDIFWFPLWFPPWSLSYLVEYCLASKSLFFTGFFFLSLTSNLRVLWSERMLDMISGILSLLKHDLWPKRWTILENVPCALEEKVYSAAFYETSYNKYKWS